MNRSRRHFLRQAALAPLAGCAVQPAAATLDARVCRVPPRGSRVPCYPTIAAAVAAAPALAGRPFRIGIAAGRWDEALVIDKPGIHLIGAGREHCRIGADRAAGQRRADGEPWGTWGCASVIVRAADFHARQLTFENRFDYLGHLRRPVLETVGANGAQAVALMFDTGADRVLLEDCDIDGHQDTLFAEAGRSWLRRCRVRGSVDFIFGAGTCVLDDCLLLSRHRPGKERQGYVLAPSTRADQPVGLLARRCRLQREPAVADASVALGRPWRPTRSFADGRYGDPAVRGFGLFVDCWMDAHIDPAGWDAMAYSRRDGQRVLFEPGEARLGEAGSHGPGARAGRGWSPAAAAVVEFRRYRPF